MPRLLHRHGVERIRATCCALQQACVALRVSWLPEIDGASSASALDIALPDKVSLDYPSFSRGQAGIRLPNIYVEQSQPILHRLEREADQNQAYAKDTHAFFGHMIGHPFDERRARADNRRDHANDESRCQSHRECMFPLLRHQATDISRNHVAGRAIRSRYQLKSRQTRMLGRL